MTPSENLPVPAERGQRRRHRPAVELLEREHGEIQRYKPPGEGERTIAAGHKFTRPQEEFAHWEEIKKTVFQEFVNRSRMPDTSPEQEKDEERYFKMVNEVVNKHPEFAVQPIDLSRLVELLRVYHFGYGPLEDYMRLSGLEDIYFNDHAHGFYYARGQKHSIDEEIFHSDEELTAFIQHVARENGLEINMEKPNLDATLKDGARLNATLPPLAVGGPDMVIRQHPEHLISIEEFISDGILSRDLADDIKRWVEGGLNIIISGGTGAGKSTLLNTIGNTFLPKDERVLILENRKELQFRTDDCKYFQTREDATRASEKDIGMRELVRFTQRKRPQRVFVGEVRGAEAYYALVAWNSGCNGSICTIHADNAPSALDKLEQLAMEAERLSEIAVQKLIAHSVDIVIQIQYDYRTAHRYVTEVVEVLDMRKFNRRDRGVVERVERLKKDKENGLFQIEERSSIWLLPLYEWDVEDGGLVRINNLIPLQGKSI